MKHETPANRKRVNLTVREDVLEEAKALGLNASRAAEAGIEAAIEAHNERIAHGGRSSRPAGPRTTEWPVSMSTR